MEQSLFQLLTPVMCLVFAVCFATIHLYDRRKAAPAWLAMAYVFGGFAFLFDFYRNGFDPLFITILTNTLYSLTLISMVIGFHRHYSKQPPYALMAGIYVVQMATILWFFVVAPDITARTIAANVGATITIGLSLFAIPRKNTMLVNRVLFWVVALSAVLFTARTLVVLFLSGETLTPQNYATSLFVMALHFSIAIKSLAMAMTCCVAFGIDAITDMKKQAITDPLSGLTNRRGLEETFEEAVARTGRTGLPFSVILADLDRFKQVNDTYGHAAGDSIIQEFASVLKSATRRSDLVARIGGEEFCLLLETADINMAKLTAEQARTVFEVRSFDNLPADFRSTASFAVAEWHKGETLELLLARADAALYNAKKNGRNRVETAQSFSRDMVRQTNFPQSA